MRSPFGDIFPEEILKGKKKHRNLPSFTDDESVYSINRILLIIGVFILGIGILLTRLFSLTIIEGKGLRKLAQENRIREIKIQAPRGIIYDRNGETLVRNIPIFISSSGDIYFEEKPANPSDVVEGVAREYVYNDLFAHLIGYTGEISTEELRTQASEFKPNRLERSDIVGKIGVEKSYDDVLRGKAGRQLFEVDALGKTVRILGRIDPVVGNNITLFVDSKLQKVAKESLEGKKGAVVATDPNTGEVLVLYSSPSFDPNIFIRGEDVTPIFSDKDRPLFNRAISGLYPPGSTFKIVTALAALEENVITKDTKYEDTGVLTIGNYSFGSWYFTQYGKKEGMLNVIGAIRRSNDIFFYKTGEALGIWKLSSWAKKVGVGSLLGIDIAGEQKGTMPDPDWRKKEKGEKWFLGNTLHAAIGQGDVLTTPLQVNAWTNVIANNGKLCQPKIVRIQNIKGLSMTTGKTQRDECKNLGIRKETIKLIREGMKQACSPGGTGWPLFKFKVQSEKLKADGVDFFKAPISTKSAVSTIEISTACKTGTSEYGDPKGKTHAWFTVFAPVAKPQISITVLVEGAGEGSSVAAPIAKEMLKEWFTY